MKNYAEEKLSFWQKIKLNQKEIKTHLLVFFIYYVFTVAWHATEMSVIVLLDYFLTVLLWASTFYTYHLVIFPVFIKRKEWKFLALIFASLLIVFLLLYGLEEIFTAFLKGKSFKIPAIDFFRFGSFWYTNFFLIALGYHFYGESIKEKQKVLIEEQKRLLAETELQETQLKLRDAELENLKAQLNPHFLFNVIWYIIVLIQDTGNQKAVRAMQILHDMMRYSMNSRTVAELVPLKEELKYAKDFIDLQILRTPVLKLDYQVVEEEIEGIKILPLVLISFIENSIKHGKLNEEENPLMIHLTVEKNKNFTFFVKNKISSSGQAWSSGIGLENVTSRLKRAYGDKHSLVMENDGTFYTTKLTIEV
jgi:two-component system, LytTR family, sensor kinase